MAEVAEVADTMWNVERYACWPSETLVHMFRFGKKTSRLLYCSARRWRRIYAAKGPGTRTVSSASETSAEQTARSPSEYLQGIVERVTYHAEDSGYTVDHTQGAVPFRSRHHCRSLLLSLSWTNLACDRLLARACQVWAIIPGPACLGDQTGHLDGCREVSKHLLGDVRSMSDRCLIGGG